MSKLKVLVIADEPQELVLLSEYLESHPDIQVARASGTDEAALYLARAESQVCLLSLRGRLADTLKRLEELRAVDGSDTPILLFGNDTRAQAAGLAAASGAAAYIRRPFRPAELAVKVRALARPHEPANLPDRQIGPRTRQILVLCSQGYDTREIAAALNVSPRNVKNLLWTLAEQTGYRSRLQLVMWAIISGRIPMPCVIARPKTIHQSLREQFDAG